MKGETTYEKVMSAAETINELDTKLGKEEAKLLVQKAIAESRYYTDTKVREAERKARREEKMIRKSQLMASISVVLLILSLVIIYLCESTVKAPDFNGNESVMGVITTLGACLLGFSVVFLFASSKTQDNFYKIEYTIYYKIKLSENTFYKEYHTKSASAAKAIARFYKLTELKYEPYKVMDEFGTLYDNTGNEIRSNYA